MTEERANEIVRKVIYANLATLPLSHENREFHIGRMVGEMQKTLEYELAIEVRKNE